MARARRVRKGLSSSTISRELSLAGDGRVLLRFGFHCRFLSFTAPYFVQDVGPNLKPCFGTASRSIAAITPSGRGVAQETVARPFDHDHGALAAAACEFRNSSRRPDRSSSVLAMKRPRPSPPPCACVALARRHIGLADAVDDLRGKPLPVVQHRDRPRCRRPSATGR